MPSPKPIVSALIVSYNVKGLLLKCLEAFYAHADVPVEAVVVDNASTDGSPAAVASEFPQATVLAQQRNLGFGRANNVGLERCQGRFVLLLNPDVTVNPQVTTHFSVSEAVDVVARLGAERAYLTHICHDLPHAETCAQLPAGVELAYDGLVLEIR